MISETIRHRVSLAAAATVAAAWLGNGMALAAPLDSNSLEEILVTATRRAESIREAPLSVVAIGGEEIERRNLVSQTDFLRTVPGVNQIEQGAGLSSIVMRGIAVNPTGEGFNMGLTTSTFLGEVPLSSGRVGQSDLRLIDIERVEILRGPQGTQFGSSAIAGALRYIPNAPELGMMGGNAKIGYSSSGAYGSSNNNVEGVLNLPLVGETLAVRAVAYRRFDSGYVRNIAEQDPVFSAQAVALGIPELAGSGRVGDTTATGGRAALLWWPRDDLSVTLTYVEQRLHQDGKMEVQIEPSDPTETSGTYYPTVAGPYDQTRWLFTNTFGGEERQRDETEIGNILVEYDLGWGDLLGSVSRSDQAFRNVNDIGQFFGDAQGGNPFVQDFTQHSKSTAVETRLTSRLDGPFSFIAGLFYEDSQMQRGGENQFGGTLESLANYYPEAGGDRSLGVFSIGDNTKQKSGYLELAYELIEGLKATAGARAFHYSIERPTTLDGIVFGGPSFTNNSGSDSGEVFKGTLSYQPSKGAMLYATWSQGFRLGFPQAPVPPNCDADGDGFIDGLPGVPQRLFDVQPDNLDNYEIGAKVSLFNDRVDISVTAFDIDWQGLPVTVFGTCGFNVVLNAGEASSRGVEFESRLALLPQVVLGLNASYTKAELANDAPGIGLRGQRLPGAPEFSARVALDYDFIVADRAAYLQTDVGYVGGFYSEIGELGQKSGDYTQVGLRGGVKLGAIDALVYVDNMTNSRGIVWSSGGIANRLRPRTVGVNVQYEF